MQPDILTNRVKAASQERCVIVCAYFGETITPDQCFLVREMLNGLDTDGWWFWQPGNFMIVFRSSRAAAERATACQSALARLSKETPSFPHVGLGSAEGDVLCGIASDGHVDTMPLGNVVNEAFRQAATNAS